MKGFLLALLIFWIISRLLRKSNVYINNFNYNQPGQNEQAEKRRKEGEVYIEDYNPKKTKKNRKDKDDGEFIDYEEVK